MVDTQAGGITQQAFADRLSSGLVRRAWFSDVMCEWLGGGERFFILSGKMGSGKTSLCAQRVKESWDAFTVFYFCMPGLFSPAPIAIIKELGRQMQLSVPGYANVLARSIPGQTLHINSEVVADSISSSTVIGALIELKAALKPEDVWDIFIREPLCDIPKPDRDLVIMIDGLDFATTYSGSPTLINLLRSGVGDLPSWVRFFCTTRDIPSVTEKNFPSRMVHCLETWDENSLNDVRIFVQRRIDDASGLIAAQAKRICATAKTNFLFAHLLMANALEGKEDSAPNESIDDIYWHFLVNYYDKFLIHEEECCPILLILSVAFEPIAESDLCRLTGLSLSKLRKRLNDLQPIITRFTDEEGHNLFSLLHQSIRDFLSDYDRCKTGWCDPQEGHARIADTWASEHAQDIGYIIRNLPEHLVALKDWDRLCAVLTDLHYISAAVVHKRIPNLLEALSLAMVKTASRRLLDMQSLLCRESSTLDKIVEISKPWTNRTIMQHLRNRAYDAGFDGAFIDKANLLLVDGKPWIRQTNRSHYHDNKPLLRITEGRNTVRWVAQSPDGAYLVSGTTEGCIRVWNAQSGQLLHTLSASGRPIRSLAYNAKANRLAASFADGMIAVWRVTDGEKLKEFVFSPSFNHMVITADGRHAFGAHEGGFSRITIDTDSRPCCDYHHQYSAYCTIPSCQREDGRLARRGGDPSLIPYSFPHRPEYGFLVQNKPGKSNGIVYSERCAMVFHALSDFSIRVIRVIGIGSEETQAPFVEVSPFTHNDSINALAISGDGRVMLSGGGMRQFTMDCSVFVRYIYTKGHILYAIFKEHTEAIDSLSLNHDGSIAASLDASSRVVCWKTATGTILGDFKAFESPVSSIHLSDDGSRLMTGHYNGDVCVWSVAHEPAPTEELDMLHKGGAISAAIDTAQNIYATGGNDWTILLWDLSTGRVVRQFETASDAAKLCFIPNSSLLVTCGLDLEGTLAISDWRIGETRGTVKFGNQLNKIGDAANCYTSLAVSPNGRWLAAGYYDGSADGYALTLRVLANIRNPVSKYNVICIELGTGKIHVIPYMNEMVKVIALGDEPRIMYVVQGSSVWGWGLPPNIDAPFKIWDTQKTDNITALAIVDSKTLLLGDECGELRVFDLANETTTCSIKLGRDAISSLAVGAEQKHLLAISGANVYLLSLENCASLQLLSVYRAYHTALRTAFKDERQFYVVDNGGTLGKPLLYMLAYVTGGTGND